MDRSYVAIDIETTGLDAKQDKIIEIGAVKMIDGEIKESFSTLINPQKKIPVVFSPTGIFSIGRGDAIRTRNQRFWRPLLYH